MAFADIINSKNQEPTLQLEDFNNFVISKSTDIKTFLDNLDPEKLISIERPDFIGFDYSIPYPNDGILIMSFSDDASNATCILDINGNKTLLFSMIITPEISVNVETKSFTYADIKRIITYITTF